MLMRFLSYNRLCYCNSWPAHITGSVGGSMQSYILMCQVSPAKRVCAECQPHCDLYCLTKLNMKTEAASCRVHLWAREQGPTHVHKGGVALGQECTLQGRQWKDQTLSIWSGSTDSKTLDYQRTNSREYQIVRTHTKETTWIQDLASPNHQ